MNTLNDPMTEARASGTDVGTHGLTRRSVLGFALSGASVALLAACTSTAQPVVTTAPAQPAPTTASSASGSPGAAGASPVAAGSPGAATPKKGGRFTMGLVGDITSLDGHSTGPLQVNIIWHHFDKLTEYDPDTDIPQPKLAESWELSSDAKSIKLNLRKGVQFHGGRELEAEDVRWNMMRMRDPKASVVRTFGVQSAWWTNIETPDKYTVILTSDQPRPGVFDLFQHMCILDKDATDGFPSTKIGGTGPYVYKEWVPGESFTSVKNPNYWRPDRPHVDEIVTKMFKDPNAMIAAFEAGTLDAIYAPPLRDAVRLRSDPKYTLILTRDLGQWFYANVNTLQKPLDNKMVRQALAHAIDRKRWTETIMRGLVGEPISLPYPPKSPAYDAEKNKRYSFDLDKSKALLAQAGVTGLAFDINYANIGFASEYQDMAQIYQADLAKLGVTTTLKPQEGTTFTAQGNATPVTYNGMRLSAGAFANFPEASTTFTFLGPVANSSGWTTKEWVDTIASASIEPDAAKRKAIYAKLNDIWLDEVPFMPFSHYPSMALTKASVKNLRYYFNPVMTYQEMWLDR